MNLIKRALACMRGPTPSDGSLSMKVARGHTGRRVLVDEDFYRAQTLATCALALWLSPWAWRVRRELRSAPLASLSRMVLFRARPDDSSIQGWEQMGPPPAGRAPDG